MLYCLPTSTNCKALENLGDENKERNHEGGENLSNRQRSDYGDCHREFHRHASLSNVFVGFMEDRKASDEGAKHTDASYIWISRASEKPDGRGSCGNKQDAINLSPIERMFVVMIVFVVGVR
jgi:hypothetical protein